MVDLLVSKRKNESFSNREGGQLASEFHSKNKDKNWIFCSVDDLDITDSEKVLKFLINIVLNM